MLKNQYRIEYFCSTIQPLYRGTKADLELTRAISQFEHDDDDLRYIDYSIHPLPPSNRQIILIAT